MFRKNLKQKIKVYIAGVALAVVAFTTYSFSDELFEVTRNLDIFTSLYKEINTYYVDSIDAGKIMRKGIDNMLSNLDPYTTFIPESDKDDYRYLTTGLYGGIGAVIKQIGDYCYISDPYEGFVAQRKGIIAGDKIITVDGVNAKGKKTDEVSHMLKGKAGTQVVLGLERNGEKIEKTLVREEIKVKSVPYYGVVRDGIGYIKLNGFTEGAGSSVADALKELKTKGELKGIILDLRGNPGGLLNEAVNVSNVFIEKGQDIVSTRGRYKDLDRSYKTINTAVDTEIPLAILVNSSSASASEIVSGSIQDLDRGIIVGQRTFGKGLVQTTRQLSYNTQVKITTSKYYIPSGRCIQALDYSHRNEDGSVGKIPDSLVTPFKTRAGRTVYNGGGVLPDVATDKKVFSNISTSMLTKNVIADYATYYYFKHPSVSSTNVILSEKEFADFQTFISGKEYDYTTKSEKSLDELKKNAEDEKYLAALQTDIDALKSKLAHDKQADVVKNKDEIVYLLEDEIASRYYFQQGRIRESLTHDIELDKAIEVLKDKGYYNGILSGAIKVDTRSAGDSDEK
jgi:carboxyl-terminal processing protease